MKAANLLAGMPDRCAYNMILDIEDPITLTSVDRRIVHSIDRFLTGHDADPVATVAATIFPASDYRRNASKAFSKISPKGLTQSKRKSPVSGPPFVQIAR